MGFACIMPALQLANKNETQLIDFLWISSPQTRLSWLTSSGSFSHRQCLWAGLLQNLEWHPHTKTYRPQPPTERCVHLYNLWIESFIWLQPALKFRSGSRSPRSYKGSDLAVDVFETTPILHAIAGNGEVFSGMAKPQPKAKLRSLRSTILYSALNIAKC